MTIPMTFNLYHTFDPTHVVSSHETLDEALTAAQKKINIRISQYDPNTFAHRIWNREGRLVADVAPRRR